MSPLPSFPQMVTFYISNTKLEIDIVGLFRFYREIFCKNKLLFTICVLIVMLKKLGRIKRFLNWKSVWNQTLPLLHYSNVENRILWKEIC